MAENTDIMPVGTVEITNRTRSSIIQVRVTSTAGDPGDEEFVEILPGAVGEWERNNLQVAFVYRDNFNKRTESFVVVPGKMHFVDT
jgi:hypothetical protein